MQRRGRLAALVLALALTGPLPAASHTVLPEEVAAGLRDAATQRAFGVVSVARDARLPRLLVVTVGPGWERVDPELRRQAAEAWHALWREAAPQGVLAIVDAAGRSRVGFDALGHARLRSGN